MLACQPASSLLTDEDDADTFNSRRSRLICKLLNNKGDLLDAVTQRKEETSQIHWEQDYVERDREKRNRFKQNMCLSFEWNRNGNGWNRQTDSH